MSTVVKDIPASQIAAGNNDRTVFDAQRLQELANSIQQMAGATHHSPPDRS